MKALGFLSLGALLLAGCTDSAINHLPKCGDFETFDLSSCSLDSLSQLDRQGAWNYTAVWNTGYDQPGALVLTPGSELFDGRAVTETHFDGRTFFLSTRVSYAGQDYRYAIAGCGAEDAQHLGAQIHFCQNNALVNYGILKAAQLHRAPGEAEASGLALVGEAKVPVGIPVNVNVANGYAYVSSLNGGLTIFDVHDPAHPTKVTQVADAADAWTDAKVRGNTLFVASAASGLRVYDLSNPTMPAYVGSAPSDKVQVHSITLSGDRLYATSPSPNAEVLTFNIENPRLPVLLSRFKATGAGQDATSWPYDVTASGNRLYISHYGIGLVIADVTDPTKPKQLGNFQWVYNSNQSSQPIQVGEKTYVFAGDENWDGHIRVLDVTDLTKIAKVVDVVGREEVSLHKMELVGTKLYVSYYQDGVRVFDVSNPLSPVQTAYFNTWRESDPGRGDSFYDGASGLQVPGDGYIYVTESSRGLMIFREN